MTVHAWVECQELHVQSSLESVLLVQLIGQSVPGDLLDDDALMLVIVTSWR